MMARVEAAHTWLSAHLFMERELYGPGADAVIKQIVAPVAGECLIRGWICRFFFIRYSENGPHIRLRMLGHPSALDALAKPTLLQYLNNVVARRETARSRTDTESPPAVKRVAWLPYIPEVERYGGPDGVHLAEELFHYSSETAIALLNKIDSRDRSDRSAKALLAMLVLIHTFCRDRKRASQFARTYGQNYLKAWVKTPQDLDFWQEAFQRAQLKQAGVLSTYLEAAWQELEIGGDLTPELDAYRHDLDHIRKRLLELVKTGNLILYPGVPKDWSNTVAAIVPSYMHMMNNRLGVSFREEAYLAALIHLTMESRFDRTNMSEGKAAV